MNNIEKPCESFIEFLERSKDDYKYAFYDPKKDEIALIKERYTLVNNGLDYYRFANARRFGLDILVDRASHWVPLGVV